MSRSFKQQQQRIVQDYKHQQDYNKQIKEWLNKPYWVQMYEEGDYLPTDLQGYDNEEDYEQKPTDTD